MLNIVASETVELTDNLCDFVAYCVGGVFSSGVRCCIMCF
jgi:hypothetical protein